MRRNFKTKNILSAALFGIVFFLGGADVASATISWVYNYHNPSVTPITALTSSSFSDEVTCTTALGSFLTTTSIATVAMDSGCYKVGSAALGETKFCAAGDVVCNANAGGQSGDVDAAAPKNDSTLALIWGSFKCSLKMYDCFQSLFLIGPTILLYDVYKIASWLLMICAYILDQMLSWSITGPLINPTPAFIDMTWTVVRDFSNMLFIFILLYTGIMTIFGEKDWKRAILWVVVMALLINFSLFFTKVVIDAGNILAIGIKDAIAGPGTGISTKIASAFEPQKFISIAGTNGMNDAMIVFVVAIIVNGYVAYIFFKMAILFSRRLIVFWALMILSPFAFISVALPKKMNKFTEWLNALTSLSFVAPIFLFFLYIIMQVINAPGPNGTKLLDIINVPGGTWFTSLLGPTMIAALLVKALQEAMKFSEDFAGTAGKEFSNLVGGAMGIVGGVAVGGALGVAGMAGRQIVGRGISALGNKAGAKLTGSDNAVARWAGRRSLALADTAKNASFEVRNLNKEGFLGKNVAKGFGAFGVDTKHGAGAWGAKSGKGGYAEEDKRNKQAKEDAEHKAAERLEMTDTEKAELSKGPEERAQAAAKSTAKAKAMAMDAEEQHKTSDTAVAVSEATTTLASEKTAAGEATKKTAAAQVAFDEAKASGRVSLVGPAQKALNDARNAERDTLAKLDAAEADLVAATEKHATSAKANDVKLATNALTIAQQDEARAIDEVRGVSKKIKEENERRREQYAKDTGGVIGTVTSPASWFKGKEGRMEARAARVARIRKERTSTQKEDAVKRAKKDESSDIEKLFKKEVERKIKEDKEEHAAQEGGGGDHGKTEAHTSPTPAAHAAPAAAHAPATATPKAPPLIVTEVPTN